ncbi:diguanylate cyclase domain-containing protein [Hydrocarboniphaga sp.]|uniref:GGDEF domain-containing protein n=1 Tax=Hydrocarboniphaga sp. TaxID=2033016 RepID=UPI003D0F1360
MRRDNTDGGDIQRESDRGWRSSAYAMDLPAEVVQQLDAATRDGWRLLWLPPDLARQFEDDVARSSRMVRLSACAIPLILFLSTPLWLPLLIDSRYIMSPGTILASTLPLSLVFAGMQVLLLKNPTYRHIEWLFCLVFLLDLMVTEWLRHQAHIDRSLFTPSVAVSIPVAVLVLGRLSILRSALFVVAYIVVVRLIEMVFDDPLSNRAPPDWLVETILLATVVMSAIWWRLSAKRIWAATILLGVLAYRDALTGLANRRALDEHFERLARQAERNNAGPLYLALIDLDHFKKINDSYGHDHGDGVLAKVGVLLSGCARRPLDMAARIGGEEFALLLYGCSAEDGNRRVDNILSDLRALAIEHREHPAGIVTCSAGGVAVPTDMLLNEALRRADHGLYRAKLEGRDRAVFV